MYPFFAKNPRPSRKKGRRRLGSKFRRNGTAVIAPVAAEGNCSINQGKVLSNYERFQVSKIQ